MSNTILCRAQKQAFCHYHGYVHMDVEPETRDGLVTIALSLSGKPHGYQFGQDTGLDLGALTPAGTLTDEAVLALTKQYGADLYGSDSHIAELGKNRVFNIAGIRKDLRTAQQQIEIDTWVYGTNPTTQRHQKINRALQLWTSDAAHRINQLAKTVTVSPASAPTLPAQDTTTKRHYINPTRHNAGAAKAFKTWFPNMVAA